MIVELESIIIQLKMPSVRMLSVEKIESTPLVKPVQGQTLFV